MGLEQHLTDTLTQAIKAQDGRTADVVRMLTLSDDELARTDVADHALEALRASRIEEVVVLGRRGPAQAAFTSAELRELGRLDGVEVRVDPADVELDPVAADRGPDVDVGELDDPVALLRDR